MSKISRQENLLPGGVPTNVRCYDNEGKTFDRFTVVFTRKSYVYEDRIWYRHLRTSAEPGHLQSVSRVEDTNNRIDVGYLGRAPGMEIGRAHV